MSPSHRLLPSVANEVSESNFGATVLYSLYIFPFFSNNLFSSTVLADPYSSPLPFVFGTIRFASTIHSPANPFNVCHHHHQYCPTVYPSPPQSFNPFGLTAPLGSHCWTYRNKFICNVAVGLGSLTYESGCTQTHISIKVNSCMVLHKRLAGQATSPTIPLYIAGRSS